MKVPSSHQQRADLQVASDRLTPRDSHMASSCVRFMAKQSGKIQFWALP